jgi:hypothetical protein
VARTPAQRGKVGNWLLESRLARGWDTQEKARAEIARLTGWTIPQSVYAEWESGRRLPSDTNLERLQGFYGDAPVSAPASEISELAASIRDLARAIQEERAERLEWERGVLESVSSLARWLGQRDDPEHVPLEDGRGVGR